MQQNVQNSKLNFFNLLFKISFFLLLTNNINSQNNLVKNKIVSPNLPNNHLKYAITWYSVALSILLYFLYFRKKQ